MGTKLERIAEISAVTRRPIFTSLYHLINEDLLKACHRELDGKKAVGIDKVTKEEYGKQLDSNIADLVTSHSQRGGYTYQKQMGSCGLWVLLPMRTK